MSRPLHRESSWPWWPSDSHSTWTSFRGADQRSSYADEQTAGATQSAIASAVPGLPVVRFGSLLDKVRFSCPRQRILHFLTKPNLSRQLEQPFAAAGFVGSRRSCGLALEIRLSSIRGARRYVGRRHRRGFPLALPQSYCQILCSRSSELGGVP